MVIYYELLLDDILKIDPLSGQIRTNRKLNDFDGFYQYEVTISDNGSDQTKSAENSKNLSGTCLINILIKEFNMHSPKFIFPNSNNSIIRIKSVNMIFICTVYVTVNL